MKIDNLVGNGDFSGGFADWTLVGAIANATAINEEQNGFVRLGTDVSIYQDIKVTVQTQYAIRFRLRTPPDGNGIKVSIQGVSAEGVTSTLATEEFLEPSAEWMGHGLEAHSGQFSTMRLLFESTSAADMDDIAVFAI